MGAHNMQDRSVGKTMREAYDRAVQNAESEHGHNGYNGTISTTGGFNDHTVRFEELLKEHGEKKGVTEWYEEAWDNTEKWEAVWGAKALETGDGDNLYLFAGWAAE